MCDSVSRIAHARRARRRAPPASTAAAAPSPNSAVDTRFASETSGALQAEAGQLDGDHQHARVGEADQEVVRARRAPRRRPRSRAR